MLLRQRLGFLEAHFRIDISKGLVFFGFPGRFFGGFAGFPARVSEGTFRLFQVFRKLVFVILGWFVKFGEAAAVSAGGCGGGEKGCTASFGAILWNKQTNEKHSTLYEHNDYTIGLDLLVAGSLNNFKLHDCKSKGNFAHFWPALYQYNLGTIKQW